MTKLRAPLTFAQATARVAGLVTYATMAQITRRKERAVRYWSEPDCKSAPTVLQALALDAAYRAAGGEDAPFLDTYALLLDVELQSQAACRVELATEIAETARECGEAIATSIAVASSNASPRATMRAVAEAEQAHSRTGALLRRLMSFLPAGAGPAASKSGGTL